jgi:hypothetical protein
VTRLSWRQFALREPEAGADWIGYWEDRREPRPSVEFEILDTGATIAIDVTGNRWYHGPNDVAWQEMSFDDH